MGDRRPAKKNQRLQAPRDWMVQQSDPEVRSKLGFSLLHYRLILKILAKLVLLQRTPIPLFWRGTFYEGVK